MRRFIRRWAPCFLVLVLLPSAIRAQEPAYEGRSLDEWIADLRGLNQSARVRATIALGRMGATAARAVPDLAYALTDPNVKVRANAAWTLAQMGDAAEAAIPGLTYALYDENAHVRGRAAVALGGLGLKARMAAVPLRDGLIEDHPGIRAASAGALWCVTGSSAESLPVLRDMLSSDDDEERIQAAQAAARVGTPAAVLVPDLTKAMGSDRPAVKAAVAGAIGAVGHGDTRARNALQDALDSETDDAVLRALNDALKAVGGGVDGQPQGGRGGGTAGDEGGQPDIQGVQTEPGGVGRRDGGGSRKATSGADAGAILVDAILPGDSGEKELRGVLGEPVRVARSGDMLVAEFAARDEGLAQVVGWFGHDSVLRLARVRLVHELDPDTAAVVFDVTDEVSVVEGDLFGGSTEPGTRTHSYKADGVHFCELDGVVREVWLTEPYADAETVRIREPEEGR